MAIARPRNYSTASPDRCTANLITGVTFFAVSFLLAVLSYRYIESPFLAMRKTVIASAKYQTVLVMLSGSVIAIAVIILVRSGSFMQP